MDLILSVRREIVLWNQAMTNNFHETLSSGSRNWNWHKKKEDGIVHDLMIRDCDDLDWQHSTNVISRE
jgi:hypothetical protein